MDESNKKAHHTDMYNSSDLILRRGQSYRITLEFNKPLTDWQSIVFTARTGPQKSGYYNTNVEFALSNSWSSGMWSAVLESSPGSSLHIIMSTPANAVIGRYDLSVQISLMGQITTYSLGKFVLLFNPWCLDDDVYMASEEERKEYVLNDHGIIFMGNDNHINNIGWNYGQFENNILNICLDILDRSLNYQQDAAADHSQRNSPLYVGRVISAMINSNDDFGVLEGKWEKDFSDGADPNSWNGSVEILWKWQNDDYKPVKYGQCWVFAAVMCTVLRCLGIPTRVITNFNSAHNRDGDMCVDMHYDTEGKFLELSDDSIWNFHVWDESWFLRRDLGHFYSGWQVLDSTPQEQSQDIYRCGPTSVVAVKEGDLHLGYDTPFVFAEVNADRVTWVVNKDGSKEKVHSDSKYIGQGISTKAVGSDARVDVTHNYKYPEGSPQEREVFEKATRTMHFYRAPIENANLNNMANRPRNDLSSRLSASTPNLPAATSERPASPAPSSRNDFRSPHMQPSASTVNLASTSGNALRSATPSGNTLRSALPSGNTLRSALPSGNTPRSALPSGNTLRSALPSGNTLRSALPSGNTRRSASPSRNTYRSASPSENTVHSASPSRNTLRPASPSVYPSRPGSGFERPDISGKFKLLSPLVVGDDINLILILKNLTPYHRPVKVNLSASCILYTGRRTNDIFTDQKSLIISPSQDAHISLLIPYSHYNRCMSEGNMIQVVALCELPFGEKVLVTKDLVLESPPIIIKPVGNAMLHKAMTLEIQFRNPLNMAVTDCILVVEGSGLIDRQLSALVPYLKPKEKIRFKVELTPYRTGTRQLIANFKCKHFSIKGYQLLNVESW